jgi:hypothetical protein
MVKKKKPDKKQVKYIEDYVVKRLEIIDLKPWQAVCKSLAPPNYDNITRTKWFEENKFRADVGRDIIAFVEETIATLQKDEHLDDMRVSDIRSVAVKGVRRAEKDQGITKYLLNDVKYATLRTIVNWIDNPERMKRKRSMSIEKSRRGRKKEKGKHKPPGIDIIREWEIVSNDTIRITSALLNNYLHPYQNVELEMDFGPNLVVISVSPYSWLPDEKKVRVGYLEAGLGVEPLETEFSLDVNIRERVETNPITCRIHYDNCDKGVRDVSKKRTATISLV